MHFDVVVAVDPVGALLEPADALQHPLVVLRPPLRAQGGPDSLQPLFEALLEAPLHPLLLGFPLAAVAAQHPLPLRLDQLAADDLLPLGPDQ